MIKLFNNSNDLEFFARRIGYEGQARSLNMILPRDPASAEARTLALRILVLLAEAGYPPAAVSLAYFTDLGRLGLKPDLTRAVGLARLGAEMGIESLESGNEDINHLEDDEFAIQSVLLHAIKLPEVDPDRRPEPYIELHERFYNSASRISCGCCDETAPPHLHEFKRSFPPLFRQMEH